MGSEMSVLLEAILGSSDRLLLFSVMTASRLNRGGTVWQLHRYFSTGSEHTTRRSRINGRV